MEPARLDALIDSLDALVQTTKSDKSDDRAYRGWQFFVTSYRHDWQPVWELCKEIQEGFSGGVHYPTVQERQRAWLRFCELRNDASGAANSERDDFQTASLSWRNRFISDADWLDYSRALDKAFETVFFPATTVEEMKKLSAKLKELVSEIHENRRNLTRAHFDECLTKTREIHDRHDTFWNKYRQQLDERREQFIERQRDRIVRIETNIEENLGRLQRCQDAIGRNNDHIDDLKEKISEARSDTWRERFEMWLVEAAEKRQSMLETRTRLREWIEQGKSELRELYKRIE